ncbi:hypothetical protein [Burkholderia cenocepacia]|uniref:hypothetical protein n=2 Tax=Burkholderia cenocepacia TaxID=95486 RepID=UPI002AB736C1|nr:hypothetical protein [Burkholderia cenocepacia]
MTKLPSAVCMTEKANGRSKSSPAVVEQALEVPQRPGETADTAISKTLTKPEVGAALVSTRFNPLLSDVNINALTAEMSRHTALVNDGNLDRVEAMLMSQAHSLDAMFNEFARRAALNMGEYLNATETYMRMALKAQSQCRATLQTLGEIKAPRSVAFIRQANLANGPQQVNNGPAPAPREEPVNPTNELLEVSNGERLDTRTTSATGAIDQELATVGEIDRSSKHAG